MLDSLSFRGKIALQILAAVMGIALIVLLSVYQLRQQMGEGRRDQLVAAVESAHAIAQGFRAQATAGQLSEAAAQEAAKEAIRLARYGQDGKEYFYIWSTEGVGVMHPIKPEWAGQNMVGKVKDGEGTDVIGALVNGMKGGSHGRAFVQTNFPRPGSTVPVPKLQFIMQVDGWNWMVGSGLYTDDLDAQVMAATLSHLAVGLAVLLVIGAIGWATLRSVMRQIGGEPAQAVAVVRSVAAGDLAVELPKVVPGSLLAAVGEMVAALRQTVTQVRHASDSIGTASQEIASGNQDLSTRTEQTASNLQQTAASMEELTSTVRQSADAARQANQLASSAAEIAARGGQVVNQVVATMDEINHSSKKINDIIGVIDGIAFQTNILALNAAVEAARAGEQGRGFAVVAGEVRNLAQRSAEAAKEIKGLIGASVDRVDAGSRLVADAGQTMSEIVASVQRVTDIIGEITAASGEQSEGIGQVNTAVNQLDQMTQQNAALVEQSAAAAESLKDQASRLSQVVQVFRIDAAGHTSPGIPR
ncbi:methyl-accepting chemotaxis protein [Hydrogenophaga taeniospiralis]|nr:methyl-accepting chemotaxis protein [Hydrogenophaga taeniospiralis]